MPRPLVRHKVPPLPPTRRPLPLSLEAFVKGRRSIAWDALLTHLRLMELIRGARRSLLGEHHSIHNPGSIKRARFTASTLLSAIPQRVTKSNDS